MPDVKPWTGRPRQEALKLVKRLGRSRGLPCHLCGEPIDYDLEYPDERSCSVEHIRSRKTHPHLTWEQSNWAPAHWRCNIDSGHELVSALKTPDLGLAVC